MPVANNTSIELIEDAMSSLRRLRAGLERAGAPMPVPEEKMSIAAVEGQAWGAPAFGFMRVKLCFGDCERYTYWTFNFWKFFFAVHLPTGNGKVSEGGNEALTQWFAVERERIFEQSLNELLSKKKRNEAIALVRGMRNVSAKQAMEIVDARVANSTLSKEHLSQLDASVKVSDRINQEYKELHGDMPLQARA